MQIKIVLFIAKNGTKWYGFIVEFKIGGKEL